jgi:phage-related baseplate assembly protein
MSDAMTSREIEDVLSSVRRLVSQESQRPATTRLILTQAQRVGPAPEASEQPTPQKQLEETIAELEAAVAASGETWESETGDDGPAPELANVTAFARRAAPEEPESAAAAPPELPEAPVAAQIPSEPEEQVLDEETLRQIVAALVREELQGQLGERVTFQVRKLVRAEIARILDERDLI